MKTTIFLCGGELAKKDNIRSKIADVLNKKNWSDVIYPEDIFDELLYSSKKKDLLSLEGLLAESVDAIVLIPESPGSFAELGAFANDSKLCNKLVCIIDKKYKKDKSFINQGPLKLVKKANKFGLIYLDIDQIEKEIEKVISVLKKMKKNSEKKNEKISLLQLENFILPSIYLLEPVYKETLVNLVGYATEDIENSFQTTTTALSILIKKNQIQQTPYGYKITNMGLNKYIDFKKTKTRNKNYLEMLEIDNLRLEILNLKNRKKKMKV